MTSVYLDNNATTAIDPRVAEVMLGRYLEGPSNPSSQHLHGRRSRAELDSAIELIGGCLGTLLDQPGGARLIITSGGTESNHLALAGLGEQGPIILSRIEHPSVIATAQRLEQQGRTLRWLEVDRDGLIQVEALKNLITIDGTRASLVSIMAANNETGVLQPIRQAADICRVAAVPMHVDGTQTVGKLPLNLEDCGVSALTFTAH